MSLYSRCHKRKDNETRQWLLKAAKGGNLTAQYEIASLYHDGYLKVGNKKCVHTRKNRKKAFHWYMKAAENGDIDAQGYMGEFYHNGRGIKRNRRKSVYWYTKAAENGDALSQFNLSVAYAKGRGVIRNYSIALHWAEKAAAQGEKRASKQIRYLKQRLARNNRRRRPARASGRQGRSSSSSKVQTQQYSCLIICSGGHGKPDLRIKVPIRAAGGSNARGVAIKNGDKYCKRMKGGYAKKVPFGGCSQTGW